jgi:hypothetical protein
MILLPECALICKDMCAPGVCFRFLVSSGMLNDSFGCRNHIRAQITLERVVITLVSFIFTRILSKLLSCKITLCVWKSNTVCRNQSYAC